MASSPYSVSYALTPHARGLSLPALAGFPPSFQALVSESIATELVVPERFGRGSGGMPGGEAPSPDL